MSSNYDGLTRNIWPGTWSASSEQPIVLDTELRGALQSISGLPGDELTNITGQRINEGMIVYVTNTYTNGLTTRTGNNYYTYRLLPGESRDINTGAMPNSELNWSLVNFSGGSGTGESGYSGFSGYSGESGFSGFSGEQGFSGYSGYSGQGFSGDFVSTLIAGTGVSISGVPGYGSTPEISIGQPVAITDSVIFGNVLIASGGSLTFEDDIAKAIISGATIPYAQVTAASKFFTNADALAGYSLSDMKPGDFYYDDVSESIYICIDTGLGYFDFLDLTVRA